MSYSLNLFLSNHLGLLPGLFAGLLTVGDIAFLLAVGDLLAGGEIEPPMSIAPPELSIALSISPYSSLISWSAAFELLLPASCEVF